MTDNPKPAAYPPGVSIKNMSTPSKLAYWKRHARKHEKRLSAVERDLEQAIARLVMVRRDTASVLRRLETAEHLDDADLRRDAMNALRIIISA